MPMELFVVSSLKTPCPHERILMLRIFFFWIVSAGIASANTQIEEIFVDVAAASGIDFVHFNGMSGELYFPEMMGAGAALLDYDNDGDLDVYLVQGHMLGQDKRIEQATFAPAHPLPLGDRLYRNDCAPAAAPCLELRFTDVTEHANIRAHGYGMGVASGDIDNDGYPDLYVMNYGPNQLLRNNGNGTFTDITDTAGVDDSRWSVSGSFVDVNDDGLLDLYVGNYVKHSLEKRRICRLSKLVKNYCGPLRGDGETDSLFLNLGEGKFEDISRQSGITSAYGGALGVIAADFNGDRRTDIYVANDGVSNLLWINQANNKFIDDALLAGVSLNKDGMAEASMGVDAADFDADGDLDLFMTHLRQETNTLYVNDGSGWFEDRTTTVDLATPSLRFTGFGTRWFDYDNDGLLDIMVVNGAVRIIEELLAVNDPYPLHQVNQLFVNTGKGKYLEVTQAGEVFDLSEVSRGAAFGDIDNDGDTDVLVTNNSGPARLLLNQVGSRNNWLGIRILNAEGKSDVYGARVSVLQDGNPVALRRVYTDGSYASASDPRIIFGLGKTASPTRAVEVNWPDGSSAVFARLEVNRYHVLRHPGSKGKDSE